MQQLTEPNHSQLVKDGAMRCKCPIKVITVTERALQDGHPYNAAAVEAVSALLSLIQRLAPPSSCFYRTPTVRISPITVRQMGKQG